MNILTKLKQSVKSLTILYIEADLNFHSGVNAYLETLFKDVYAAHNAASAMREYMQHKPDIILTDLCFADKNSFEVIIDIKNINDEVPIIVLSNRNDEFELLESLDLDIVALLEKPFDKNLLNNALLLAATNIAVKTQTPTAIQLIEYSIIQKTQTGCINNYKGLVIKHPSELLSFHQNKMKMKISTVQFIAAIYEKQIIIVIDNNHIIADVIDANQKENQITVANFELLVSQKRDNKNKRITVDKSFKVKIQYKNIHVELQTLDVSYDYISMESDKNIFINVNDTIDLTIGFEIKAPSQLIKEKNFTKVFATGKIIRVEKKNNKQNIIAELFVKRAGQNVFKKYLQERELEIITEFKKKMQ
ncbi:MAG: response regulator [Arcobacteraceae bacterium]